MLHGTPSNKRLHPQEKCSGGNERSSMSTNGELESTGDASVMSDTRVNDSDMDNSRHVDSTVDVSEDRANDSSVDVSEDRADDSSVDVSGEHIPNDAEHHCSLKHD